MTDIALRVEGLGKRYRLGMEQAGGMHRYKSIRDSLVGLARRPVDALRSTFTREPMDETNSFWALHDLNFEVKRGEVVGIIGRNGAGKSTLLKILSRITKPLTGHAALYGRVGSLLEVGTGFHPELTGRENIYLNGAILGMTRAEVKARFDEIVAFSEVEKFLDTPVKHYSSGMYMRLAFAVAAHLDPEILIIDEVLAVGDAAFQKKSIGRMSEVAQSGRTVLFVSHNMAVIRELCETAIWLDAGSIRAIGQAVPVLDKYMDALSPSNLAKEANRWTNGRVTLLGIEALDAEGDPSETVRAGERWSIRARYRLSVPIRTGVSLRITSSKGPIAIDCHEWIGGADERAAGEYLTTMTFDTSALSPGAYLVSVYFMVHHGGHQEVQFHHCMSFTVEGVLHGYNGTVRQFDVEGLLYAQPKYLTQAVAQ